MFTSFLNQTLLFGICCWCQHEATLDSLTQCLSKSWSLATPSLHCHNLISMKIMVKSKYCACTLPARALCPNHQSYKTKGSSTVVDIVLALPSHLWCYCPLLHIRVKRPNKAHKSLLQLATVLQRVASHFGAGTKPVRII